MSHVLSLREVTLAYGNLIAVDSLSLTVAPGEVFGLLGPNGCGKSTTLAAIVGSIAPSSGEILVAGKSERSDPLGYRRLIGLVPQEVALFDELSAENNLAFFGRLYGLSGKHLKTRVCEVLDFVRLSEHARRLPRTFSGGMKRRLNLACALLHDPALLLLDEPTVGIDIQSRDAIFLSLRELCRQGTAIVFTTHHLEEAELLCDRIGILDHGYLLAAGTVEELCSAPVITGKRWRVDGPHPAVPPRRIAHTHRLESVFLELTGRSLRES